MATTQIVRQSDYSLAEPPPREVSDRWITEVYDERGKDFRTWLFSKIYWSTVKEGGKNNMAEAVAEACMKQIEVTYDLAQLMDQSLIIEAWQAQQYAWWTMLGKSYDSLSSVLEKALAKAPESERYDLMFWVEYLLPALEYLGYPIEDVVSIPEKYSKARAAVPTLRRLWRSLDSQYRKEVKFRKKPDGIYWEMGAVSCGPFEDEATALKSYQKRWYEGVPKDELLDFGKQLHGVIEMITGDIAVRPFREELQKMSGRVPGDAPASSWMLQTRIGEFLFIQSNGPKQTTMIANRLNGLVEEPGVTDPMTIIHMINDWFASTARKRRYYDLNLETQTLSPISDERGVELITVESFGEQARLELAKALIYLIQVSNLLLPIYEICPIFPNVVDATLKRFGISTDLPLQHKEHLALEVIPNALVKLYREELTNIIRQILPKDMQASMLVVPHPANGHVTFCLDVVNCQMTK